MFASTGVFQYFMKQLQLDVRADWFQVEIPAACRRLTFCEVDFVY